MAWWTTLGLAGGTAVGGAAVAVVGAAAFVGYVFIYPQFRPADPTPAPQVDITAPATPVPDTASPAPSAAEPTPPVGVDAGPPPPVFDVVRIDAQGAALIAGIAPAGMRIDILLDGSAVFESRAGGDGRFVALFDIAASEQPRSLQLAAIADDTTTVLSEQTVLVAPFGAVAPVAVAEVAPQAPVSQPDAPEGVAVAAPSIPETPTAPQLIIADASGVRPLQPGRVPQAPTPEARANVIIDTISYDATGAVELAGRGTAQAFVRIYLDNVSVADSGVAPSGGWEAVLLDITPGIYTLRVDELDETGRVTSRFETPFKREDPKLLAQITGLLAPAAPVEQTTVPDAPLAGIADVLAAAPAAPVAPVVETPTTRIASASQDSAPVVAAAPSVPVLASPGDQAPITPAASVITVQPGFTLWQIARERFGEGELYVQVFEANRDQIKDPNRIFPGQVFTLPDVSDRR